MYLLLKRLELQGFKSFADKTILEFVEGSTAVVGPNGSGKSNISDAIRWVIGEMSAKSLRGSNMQDVIFAGTETRKPVNFAEVSLVLDNSSHLFDINYDEVVVARKAEYDRAYKKLMNAASLLSSQRKKTALNFSQDIINALKQLNFLDVRFEAEFEEKNPDSTGTDNVRFMISTNPGEDMKPLAKIASGGELSRIMLAIKSVMAETDVSKTLIFDEIDAGISGKTAQLVAEKLNTLSKTHQIICITHLPQIAAMADNHYVIEKSTKDNRTISNITKLSYDESIGELARMLGGSSITDAVVSNAKELKNMAQTAKNN